MALTVTKIINNSTITNLKILHQSSTSNFFSVYALYN